MGKMIWSKHIAHGYVRSLYMYTCCIVGLYESYMNVGSHTRAKRFAHRAKGFNQEENKKKESKLIDSIRRQVVGLL